MSLTLQNYDQPQIIDDESDYRLWIMSTLSRSVDDDISPHLPLISFSALSVSIIGFILVLANATTILDGITTQRSVIPPTCTGLVYRRGLFWTA